MAEYQAPQKALTTASGQPQAPKPQVTIIDILDQNKKEMLVGAPKGFDVSYERLRRTIITEVKKNPTLAKADPYSLLGAVMQANNVGLEIGSLLGQAYLVPFYDKGVQRVQLILGYQGMIDLAFRSGKLDTIYAEVIYEADTFEYYIEDGVKRCRWIPLAKGDEKSEAKIVKVLAAAQIRGGGIQYHVMDIEEIVAVEKRFRKGPNMSKPWRDDFTAMARKTALRRLFAFLPKSAETRDAMIITAQEGGDHRYLAEQNLKNVTPEEKTSEPLADTEEAEAEAQPPVPAPAPVVQKPEPQPAPPPPDEPYKPLARKISNYSSNPPPPEAK